MAVLRFAGARRHGHNILMASDDPSTSTSWQLCGLAAPDSSQHARHEALGLLVFEQVQPKAWGDPLDSKHARKEHSAQPRATPRPSAHTADEAYAARRQP